MDWVPFVFFVFVGFFHLSLFWMCLFTFFGLFFCFLMKSLISAFWEEFPFINQNILFPKMWKYSKTPKIFGKLQKEKICVCIYILYIYTSFLNKLCPTNPSTPKHTYTSAGNQTGTIRDDPSIDLELMEEILTKIFHEKNRMIILQQKKMPRYQP